MRTRAGSSQAGSLWNSQEDCDVVQDVCWVRRPADMARPLSNDLRERVVARHEAGESTRAVAELYGLAPSTVTTWTQRRCRTGSVAPGKFGGHRRPLLELHRDWIETRLRETPELTLQGLRGELASRGIRVSYGAVQKFVRDAGLSFKKPPSQVSRTVPMSPAAMPSRPSAPIASSCHPTVLISIPSSRSSQSSSSGCEEQRPDPSRKSTTPSLPSSIATHPRNAPHASETLAMLPPKMILL